MRTFECGGKTIVALLAAVVSLALSPAAQTWAGQETAKAVTRSVTTDTGALSFSERLAAYRTFATPVEAYRQGITAYREGWYDLAVAPLEYAAQHNIVGAQLALADMYAQGKGVFKDEARAFDLYRRIVQGNRNADPYDPAARLLSPAYVALGRYYRSGLRAAGVRKDDAVAADLFIHAASFFDDPAAQYQLARLYLAGEGVPKNIRRAVNWLKIAARKNYAPALALLGQLLWEGELIKRRPVNALALLTLAREHAKGEDVEWIELLYQSIVEESAPRQMESAKAVVAKWRRRDGERKPRLLAAPKPGSPGTSRKATTLAKPMTGTPSEGEAVLGGSLMGFSLKTIKVPEPLKQR